MLSAAHIFYIPIILFIGFYAGIHVGRRMAEADARARKKIRQRRATKTSRDDLAEE